MRWRTDTCRGTAADLHAADLPLDRPTVWLMEPTDHAVVLGSAQPDDLVDADAAAAAGVVVARRRSGGGLVEVGPGLTRWVDVTLPRADPRWSDDVLGAFGWLGDRWAAAVGGGALAWTDPPAHRAEGRVACFAGVGAGEVVVGGRKVVGLSQRRTRQGVRFQCVLYRAWDPALVVSLLGEGIDAALRRSVVDRLTGAVAAAGDADAVVDRFLASVLALPV